MIGIILDMQLPTSRRIYEGKLLVGLLVSVQQLVDSLPGKQIHIRLLAHACSTACIRSRACTSFMLLVRTLAILAAFATLASLAIGLLPIEPLLCLSMLGTATTITLTHTAVSRPQFEKFKATLPVVCLAIYCFGEPSPIQLGKN